MTDEAGLKSAIEHHQITHVVHLAGLQVPTCRANPILGAKVNVLGTLAVFEAGTRYVQVKWYDWDWAWDIHGFNSTGVERMEEELCPRFDQGMSALLDDPGRRRSLADAALARAREFTWAASAEAHLAAYARAAQSG